MTDFERADAFANALESQFTLNPPHPDFRDFYSQVEEEVETEYANTPLSAPDREHQLRDVTVEELQGYVADLCVKKAPGPDGIRNSALRALPPVALKYFAGLCNAAFRLQHFPQVWRTADVVMIPKPGKSRKVPSNYRPISLLSALGKLFEKTLLVRLQEEIDFLELLPAEQHGFRARHSTVHQLVRVVEYIVRGYNWRHCVGGLFLDISKAFDRVWHAGLVWKVSRFGISKTLVSLIRSYLQQRTFRVRAGTSYSTARPITAGVPQGSLLGPVLYLLYASDMPRNIPGTIVAQYADDTAILASSLRPELATRRLQAAADRLELWTRRWRIEVNADKSTAVLFHRLIKPKPFGHVIIGGSRVWWCKEATYLGVVLDQRLTFASHIQMTRRKAYAAVQMLFPLLSRQSSLSIGNKVLLYKTCIRPVMTYAAPAWGFSSKTNWKRLQAVQSKVLRMAANSPWYIRNSNLHRDLDIPMINEFCNELISGFFDSASSHPNPTIAQASEYLPDDKFRHRRPRNALAAAADEA